MPVLDVHSARITIMTANNSFDMSDWFDPMGASFVIATQIGPYARIRRHEVFLTMPVFQVHVPEDRFSPVQKLALARAMPWAPNEALRILSEDPFVAIPPHPAGRALADKRWLAKSVCEKAIEVLGIGACDVFTALTPGAQGESLFRHRRTPARAAQLTQS